MFGAWCVTCSTQLLRIQLRQSLQRSFTKTKHQMWLAKLDNTLRRMCTPSGRTGKLEVSAEVRTQWLKGGTPRKNLMDILVKFNGDKACLTTCQLIVCFVLCSPSTWNTFLKTFPCLAGCLQEEGGAYPNYGPEQGLDYRVRMVHEAHHENNPGVGQATWQYYSLFPLLKTPKDALQVMLFGCCPDSVTVG